ncbi:hypothetical protein [Burkholderia pseudomallei]|uniref:hypothetical protein n=1 Tax=Burkholderia pseudomallei TaxID=28450 RepID=UPI00015F7C41|nr:hypothetical protein [Burkholderia pseudomallei]AJX61509.1 hypothetical protein DP47_3440 [Burkholderia pseudomallei Pasteur 52237]EDO95268.1 hypothetical protein BURPSPAST_M0057 [Burkholderia pseudomallei Pasteur 52237]
MRKSDIAKENVSRLASIGLAAMEHETARVKASVELAGLRAARKEEDCPTIKLKAWEHDYAAAAKARKNSRARLQREIARYHEWRREVNA